MEDLGIISRVDKPSDCCAPIVVVPKGMPKVNDASDAMPDNNGLQKKVQICVDLTKLNKNICQPRYILPSVVQTLG